MKIGCTLLLPLFAACILRGSIVSAFSVRSAVSSSCRRSVSTSTRLYADTTQQQQQDAFATFADSLESEPNKSVQTDEEHHSSESSSSSSWQEQLETLMDPTTPLAQRQVLLTELLAANQDIRDSVAVALRERNIDPLLTPTGRKLQDGTRAVARQLTTDILPTLAEARPPPPSDIASVVPKVGSRILNALSRQAQQTLQDISEDLQDPTTRIPARLSQQGRELQNEVKNVFLETPEGLVGPKYTVVGQGEGYEIRQYDGYKVASTTMMGESSSLSSSSTSSTSASTMTDLTSSGAAFNALAAYLFGANQEGRAMAMTTPVTTTSLGEMRFYLQTDDDTVPAPLEDGKTGMYEAGAVQIIDIPPARLAVRRFTGFVTEGEVQRQKDTLLSQLEMDGVEIDVPHGAVVPHVIFQYNPPYTIPMVRRNEIAVPVRAEVDVAKDLETEWGRQDDVDLSPSDVE